MDAETIIKSTQEQGTAAWINMLNQIRLDKLLETLNSQDIQLEKSLEVLRETKGIVAEIITSNRGGAKGSHGFLAEVSEVGIRNARDVVKGLKPESIWVNDNGPVDIVRNGIPIQQKFVQKDFSLGQNGVSTHIAHYPDFVKSGGKYQIPKDYYEKITKLLSMSEKEASRLNSQDPSGLTYSNWKEVRAFFEKSGIQPKDIEPSVLKYSEVQRDTIQTTLNKEEKHIKDIDQERRQAAREESKPSLNQGVHATVVSAAIEGGAAFCMTVAKKLKSGKKLSEFTKDDWAEAGIETTKGTWTGAVRGASVYLMTNFTATPDAVANSFVTAVLGVASMANKLRRGDISEEDFLIDSQVLCLDVTVSAIASLAGQTLIPIPVLGAVIGNVLGMFMYGIAKESLNSHEQELINSYAAQIAELNERLGREYDELVKQIMETFKRFSSALDLAFDVDVNKSFSGSIQLALEVGVPRSNILFTKEDIDKFFTD